jgi:GNAT superfamily N-acetyltransferase
MICVPDIALAEGLAEAIRINAISALAHLKTSLASPRVAKYVETSMNIDETFHIEPATLEDVFELARLHSAYRSFYGEPPDEHRVLAFISERVERDAGRYFLAWSDDSDVRPALGFMHLMPSTNTLAMRPIWLLEDLFVEPAARGMGVATRLLERAERFARDSGAERLTLSTAHDNLVAQRIYQRLGYVKEEHFWYFHRLLP